MSENDDIEVDSDADKRAHHNALERKRRDHIKDSFHGLRDSVPSLQGEKVRCKGPVRSGIKPSHSDTCPCSESGVGIVPPLSRQLHLQASPHQRLELIRLRPAGLHKASLNLR
ncbi:hypothetical protein CHARACLAT_013707 [Characodon lateralis]|uniref:Protein max n=1 Tax=Characodon lateralis TaxID=208331 RepID=A0ABU7EIV3_9TELE|nr:hypothetical protein [Characodon lateralis]